MPRHKLAFIMLLLLSAGVLLVQHSGCKKDESPVEPPADTGGISGLYGKGAVSFNAAGGGGLFSVSGKYRPSDQFANDTLGEGAGGFVADTALFGRKINAMLSSYFHALKGNVLNERLLAITLYDSSGVLRAGAYPFSHLNSRIPGQAAYLYFFISDSSNQFQLFVPKSGALTLSSYDGSDRHGVGIFSGTICKPPPDTATQIQITGGSFDIYFSNRYFNY